MLTHRERADLDRYITREPRACETDAADMVLDDDGASVAAKLQLMTWPRDVSAEAILGFLSERLEEARRYAEDKEAWRRHHVALVTRLANIHEAMEASLNGADGGAKFSELVELLGEEVAAERGENDGR